jgi:hypothetical protein
MTDNVKQGFEGVADRSAWLCGVSAATVKRVVAEGTRGEGWADPSPRGGQPWEKIDIAPHDQIAAVRRAHAELAAKPMPTSAANIKKHMEAHGFTDADGNAIVLPKHRILRILHICSYRFGSARHHHVANRVIRISFFEGV